MGLESLLGFFRKPQPADKLGGVQPVFTPEVTAASSEAISARQRERERLIALEGTDITKDWRILDRIEIRGGTVELVQTPSGRFARTNRSDGTTQLTRL